MTSSHDIILINPPYSTMANPYITVPLLHAYLKKESVNVFSCDLNPLLYKQLADPGRVRRGIAHVKQRFRELNSCDTLRYSESIEYKMFSILLFQLSYHGDKLTKFVNCDYSFDEFKQVRFNKLLITASSALSFPEMIVTYPQFAVNPLYESCSVSDILKSLSHTNDIMDIIYRSIDSLMEAHDAPIFGISVPFQDQVIKAFQCAAYIKKKRPDAFVIMGGPSMALHFKHFPDNTLFSMVDAFAYYEGEKTLTDLVHAVKTGGELKNVPGIAFIDNGKIVRTQAPETHHINESVIPEYEAMGLDDFMKTRDDMTVPIRLSKGCAWGKCTFCSSYQSQYQELDADRALDHLLSIYHGTGIRKFMFSDEASPLRTLDYIAKNVIELGLSIQWKFHTRLTTKLTRERCDLYKKAGCRQIFIGIESTSDRILKKMNKGISFEQIDEFFNTIDPVIPIGAYMIVGFPGERDDEAEKGFQYLNRMIERKKLTSFVYSQFVIKPGSAIWNDPEAFGISKLTLRSDLDLNHNVYRFTSDGMPLEKVYDYFYLFSGKEKLDRIFAKIKDIRFQDMNEPLNFPMKDVNTFIASNTDFFNTSMWNWFLSHETLSRAETATCE